MPIAITSSAIFVRNAVLARYSDGFTEKSHNPVSIAHTRSRCCDTREKRTDHTHGHCLEASEQSEIKRQNGADEKRYSNDMRRIDK